MSSPTIDLPKSQKAIRWYPPSYDVRVEEIPSPEIQDPDDAVVKVLLAGLCGSDLHIYRGHGGVSEVHVGGHEFVGEIVALGSSFGSHAKKTRPEGYSTFKVGDKVVAPFTISCGECHPCRLGFSSRCAHSLLLGSPALPGAQAQYIRIPKAGGTLVFVSSKAVGSTSPSSLSKIPDESLLLLADILPTGIFAAVQALNHPKTRVVVEGWSWPGTLSPSTSALTSSSSANSLLKEDEDRTLTLAVVGLGPVGICACIALVDMLFALSRKTEGKVKWKVVAVDMNEKRRAKVAGIWEQIRQSEDNTYGIDSGNFVVKDVEEAKKLVKSPEWGVNGLGCTAVLEVVGLPPALSLAYDLVRPFGVISSVGVHSAAPNTIPFTGANVYDKNISLDFGRCPARSMITVAAELLVRRGQVFGVGEQDGSVGTGLVEKVAGFGEAKELYEAFDKGKIGKVLFDPWM